MNKKILTTIILSMLVVADLQPALAQVNQLEFVRTQFLRPSVHFKTWNIDDESGLDRFTELAFPVTYTLPVTSRLGIDVTTSPFRSKLEPTNGNSMEFNNITDTFVRGSYIVGNNVALITVGVGIPSGETDLSNDELAIAGLAANRPLGNPVTNFGTGVNVSFGLALAQNLGSWVFGVGFGYSLRQEYDTTINNVEFEIDPGDELNITFGIEREFEVSKGRAKFVADFIYTNYSEDELAGRPFFESGDKFLIRGQYIFPFAIFNPVILSATNRTRLDNEASNAALLDNGNELELRATLIQRTSDKFSLKYLVRTQIYGDTVDDSEGAFIYGIGGGIILKLADAVSINPTVIFSKGSINTGPDSDIDITGIEVTGGLSIKF